MTHMTRRLSPSPGPGRRRFLQAAGLALAGGMLGGCAGVGRGAPDNTADDGRPIERLEWWSNHPGGSRDVELELIARYEEQHPGITVTLVDAGKDYDEIAQKFNAALTGADLPDIVVLSDVWWYNFALNEQIAPVSTLAGDAGVDTDAFVDSLYADYLLGGEHYALPFARSTPLFYYNRDAWRAAGLPDRGPETWPEMAEFGRRLQEKAPESQPMGWYDSSGNLSWIVQAVAWENGGGYSDDWDFTLTSEPTIEAVSWFQDATVPGDGWSYISSALEGDFSAGITASGVMSTGSLAGLSEYATFPIGTAPLPDNTPAGSCPTGGAGLAVPANLPRRRQLEALKFIDFVTSPENTAYWSREVGYMPVRDAALDLPEQRRFLADNPNFRTAIDQLPRTRPQDLVRTGLPGADPRLGGALEEIAVGREDVARTLGRVENTLGLVFDNQVAPLLDSRDT